MENIITQWGLLWIWNKETDFKFWSSEVALELLSEKSGDLGRQPIYEYNQHTHEETRYSCTLFSAITELSYLLDRQFTEEEILHYNSEAIKAWILDPKNGAFLEQMINFVMKLWNQYNPTRQVEYYQIDYLDKELRDILIHKVPRLTQIGYHTSTELFVELEKTWVALKDNYPIYKDIL